MSLEAVKWALADAPDVPAHCVGTLWGLANHAKADGTDAWPAIERLAWYARKSERGVQRDLRELEERGLIRQGDQRAAYKVPERYRPTVWDLAIELTRGEYVPKRLQPGESRHGVEPPDDPSRGDACVTPGRGVTPTVVRGDTSDARGVTPASPEPSEVTTTEKRKGESSVGISPEQRAPARARTPLPPTADLDPAPAPAEGPPAELGGPGHAKWKEAKEALQKRPRRAS